MHFLQAAQEALAGVASAAGGIVALVGFPERTEDVYNALAVLVAGAVHAVYRKTMLSNYGVPGVKITPRAFGRDRRMPITSAYRGA